MRLFRSPAFSGSLVVYMIGTFVAFGIYVFIAQYLQLVLGLSPLAAGLWTIPSMAAFIVGSMVVPLLVRRIRPPYLIGAGLVLAAVGFAILTQVEGPSAIPVLVTGSVIYSLGTSPVVILATDLIVGSVPVERAGAASAMSETSSELGGALGIAILGSLGTAVYRSAMAIGVPPGVPSSDAAVAKATLGGALSVAAGLPAGLGAPLLETSRAAFAQAFAMVAGICAAVSVATAVVALVLLRRVPTGAAPAPSPALAADPALESQ
jgi:DHA2 family multidrug resistance protein-like MFS transporter